MNKTGKSAAGLAALRRDGKLFALLAALLMLVGTVHPLAEARAAGTPLGWQICSAFGQMRAPDGAQPGAADDCPACIAGACAAAAGKAVQPSVPAFAPLARSARPIVRHERHVPWHVMPRGADAAIRAPPALPA